MGPSKSLYIQVGSDNHSSASVTFLQFSRECNAFEMKSVVLLFAFVMLCSCAPAPEPAPAPAPKPAPAPAPAPKPGLIFPASPAIITSPLVSYSHYIKSPLYPTYQPYVYNLGYASGYSYNAYPYYVPLHLI